MAETAVAIYWDFENVHACLIDDEAGEQTYRTTARYRSQEVVIDVARIAGYAAGFGRVAVHRAYANWQYFGKYAADLQAQAIDLVQLFPLTSTKNGADIRLRRRSMARPTWSSGRSAGSSPRTVPRRRGCSRRRSGR